MRARGSSANGTREGLTTKDGIESGKPLQQLRFVAKRLSQLGDRSLLRHWRERNDKLVERFFRKPSKTAALLASS